MADINIFIAFAAGVLSFLSPCVLPLLPSYVSYVGGVSLEELRSETPDRAVLFARTLMFVLGFTIVFVVLGVLFSGSVVMLGGTARYINLIAGGIVIVLGLNVMFDFFSVLNREKRVHVSGTPRGYFGSAAVGMAFGAGWTPCIGPVLASILFLAGSSAHVTSGVLYLLAYSFGLGVPFLLASLFFAPVLRRLEQLKPYLPKIKTATGGLLIIIGVLIASGRFQQLQATLFRWAGNIERWSATQPLVALWSLGLAPVALALLPFSREVYRRLRGGEHRRLFTPARVAVSLFFAVFAVLHFTRVLPLSEAIAAWFMYEGL